MSVNVSCDLLRINYLCGRITNANACAHRHQHVVICSELTTFAVESPTGKRLKELIMCCDLLRINYLCGRITNATDSSEDKAIVVICSELTTFAVESPTGVKLMRGTERCDLLRINYLCGRITNI